MDHTGLKEALTCEDLMDYKIGLYNKRSDIVKAVPLHNWTKFRGTSNKTTPQKWFS